MKTASMKTLTVSLSAHQVARLHSAVATGQYASSSEVVRDALRLWEQREDARQLELSRLKRAYDDGMASGDGRALDAKSMLAELKAEARKRG
jgi:antitoxin ParD1/3/4